MFQSFLVYSLDMENHQNLKSHLKKKSLDFVNIWKDVMVYYLS